MLIRVDLPAPFSPTTPWIEPAAAAKLTRRLASTAPKRFEIPSNRTAGSSGRDIDRDDLAGQDIGLGLIDPRLHLGRDQRPVIVVDDPAQRLFLEPERQFAAVPAAVVGRHQ